MIKPINLAIALLLCTTQGCWAQGFWHQLAHSARASHQRGDFQAAERDWLEALDELPAEDPRRPESLFNLGKVYLELGETEKAEAALRYGIEDIQQLRPINIDTFTNLLRTYSQVLQRLGHTAEAQHYLERWQNITPKVVARKIALPTWKESLTLGDRYEKQEKYKEAEEQWLTSLAACEKFEKNDTRLAHPLKRLLAYYSRSNQPAKSELLLRRYIDLTKSWYGESSQQYASLLRQHARLLSLLKRPDEANSVDQQARTIESNILAARAASEAFDEGTSAGFADISISSHSQEVDRLLRQQERLRLKERQWQLMHEEELRLAARQESLRQQRESRDFEDREMARHHALELAVMRFGRHSPQRPGLNLPGCAIHARARAWHFAECSLASTPRFR